VKTDDPGRPGKRAEHYDDTAILPQMGNGLDTATGHVLVSHTHIVQDLEGAVVALRAAVDVTAAERGGSDEKDGLSGDELGQLGVYGGEGAAHGLPGSHRRPGPATNYSGELK
jgi:hypothetical protein